MGAQTVSISLDLPDDCAIESLQSQLLQYARHLIQSDNYRKKQYAHEELCGILKQKTDHQELIDDYLKEKFYSCNTKDYKNTNNNVIHILSPRQFVESVL